MQTASADSAAADPILGRVLEGRYRIHAKIARGGMSTVYRATDERLERNVAVKIMSGALSADPAFADRFAREARAAARLSHLNVVAVFDQGSDAGHVFLVMELVTGRTLRDLLRERGRLSPAEAISILEPVLGALAAAHRAGLVHRDIKPENILLADDGVVKVVDFGLARAVDTDPSSTRTGLMMGTVAYCAPEQISKGEADQRTDVYAAGVVLFELLTGSVPFVGETAMAVAYQHVHSRVPAASSRVGGIAEVLDDLIIRATDSDASFRPADAAAMLAELHDIRDALQLPVTAIPARPRPAPSSARPVGGFASSGRTPGPRSAAPREAVDEAQTQVFAAVTDAGLAELARDDEHSTAVVPRGGFTSAELGAPGMARATGANGRGAARGPGAGSNAGPGSGPRSRPGASDGPDPEAPQKAPRTAPQRRRRRALIITVVVCLLGAALGLGTWWLAAGRYSQLPNVAGEPFDTASAALHKAGFSKVATRRAYDETVTKGSVISTSPGAGSRMLPAKTVTLTISNGQERFVVPDVHGGSEAAARAALAKVLTDAGTPALQIIATQQSDDTVPKGTVIGTNPASGQPVKRDSVVTVIVSSGPPVLAVPDVSGKSQNDATTLLTGTGFKVITASTFSDSVASGTVVSQDPTAGTQSVKFSSVTITVSKGPQYLSVPSVGGMRAAQATQALTNAGFQVQTKKVFTGHLDLVVGTEIDPDDQNSSGQVRAGATITIDVA